MPSEPLAAVAAKRVHVFTLRVSPRLAGRVKQAAEIRGESINALLTHWVWEGLRPKDTAPPRREPRAAQRQVSGVGPTRPRSLGAILCDRY